MQKAYIRLQVLQNQLGFDYRNLIREQDKATRQLYRHYIGYEETTETREYWESQLANINYQLYTVINNQGQNKQKLTNYFQRESRGEAKRRRRTYIEDTL